MTVYNPCMTEYRNGGGNHQTGILLRVLFGPFVSVHHSMRSKQKHNKQILLDCIARCDMKMCVEIACVAGLTGFLSRSEAPPPDAMKINPMRWRPVNDR